LYSDETWTLRKVDHKYLETSETGAGEKWKILLGTFTSEIKKYYTVSEDSKILHTVIRRKANWIGHTLLRNTLLNER
jgi:hypothetical protein